MSRCGIRSWPWPADKKAPPKRGSPSAVLLLTEVHAIDARAVVGLGRYETDVADPVIQRSLLHAQRRLVEYPTCGVDLHEGPVVIAAILSTGQGAALL